MVGIPRNGDENDSKRLAVKEVLSQMADLFDRTYFVDLYTYAPEYNQEFREKYFLGHMTATGYILTARIIESYIDFIIRKNPKDFSQVGFIGTDLYFEPEDR